MKVLFVVEHYYPHIGGVEKLFKGVAEALAREGNDVTILTTKFRKGLKRVERKNGVKIIRLNTGNRYGFTVLSIPMAYRLAKRVDIIHTTSYNAAIPAYLAGKFSKKKMIITFHEVWGNLWDRLPFLGWWQRRSFKAFEKMILNLKFDRFIAVSRFTSQKLEQYGIDKNRITTIYNGINYDFFERIQPLKAQEKFVFTFYGRLGVSKGFDLLIPAFADVIQKNKSVILKLIIPRQPQTILWEVNQLIKRYKVAEHVDIMHELHREDLFREVVNSDCVVIPSYSEGFCFVAAECAALKVPVISSGKGALKEVVSGKFIEMENQRVDALAKSMRKALNEDWNSRELRRFPLKDTISEYLKLYEVYKKSPSNE